MRAKFLWNDKDGGPESKGWIWGIEIKSLFSVLLIKFEKGSRDAFHSHAFDAYSWLLLGSLVEMTPEGETWYHVPSFTPIFTSREHMHKVICITNKSWAITFRGPWAAKWHEFIPGRGHITLTEGRKELES